MNAARCLRSYTPEREGEGGRERQRERGKRGERERGREEERKRGRETVGGERDRERRRGEGVRALLPRRDNVRQRLRQTKTERARRELQGNASVENTLIRGGVVVHRIHREWRERQIGRTYQCVFLRVFLRQHSLTANPPPQKKRRRTPPAK